MTAEGWRLTGATAAGEAVRLAVADAALRRAAHGLTLGRHPGLNSFAIADDTVSRRHARLTRTGDGLAIEDLHSLNGVWVDGARLPIFRPAPIGAGVEIALGRVRLRVSRIAG